jgi:hypothetical protein
MQNNNQLAIIALVAALAILGVVVVTVATLTIQLQEAEAKGCIGNNFNSRAVNASKGRCVHS